MKIVTASTLASIALVAACTSAPHERTDAPSAAASHHYRCESGATVAAVYLSTDSATVRYGLASYKMRIAISGSGARYVGDGLEWWTKGVGVGAPGTLFRHLADGAPGEIIERCVEY
jgi:membrane-bound inhibitor of C-type lysozyme